ncbi:MAG: dUTP diphosphatase [Clostridia bacterium]|nr:dUTP diphosphatase [Clostridia bacterium]
MKIRFIKTDERAQAPKYGTEFSAGADICALDEVTLSPGQTVLIHTGIAVEIPDGYAGFIYARSGMATKRGLAPANKVGVIDSDYRGEIMVAMYNQSSENRTVMAGERVAQMVIAPYIKAEFDECETLDETLRGSGGFGSTGRS